MKKIIIFLSIVGVLTAGITLYITQNAFKPTATKLPIGVTSQSDIQAQNVTDLSENTQGIPSQSISDISVVAQNLSIPWDILFLSEADVLVTQRTGTIVRLSLNDANTQTEISVPLIGKNVTRGEGGLLGLLMDPKFSQNNWLYIYQTYSNGSGTTTNRITRYTLSGDTLTEPFVVLDNIPGAIYHDGGRMSFGPDGLLYIATGDATIEDLAQDVNSLAGKILRVRSDGTIPTNNPFGNEVYSLGHRNPQGLTWDDRGQLWSTEHGRSGVVSGMDEVNLITAGANYGWPIIEGDTVQAGLVMPKAHSGPDETWAPASALYWNGSIFFAGLRGESLYEAKLNDQRSEVKEIVAHFRGEYGRLRSVTLGPDNYFYLTTSNTDGRAKNVKETDDLIIRINPSIFR